MIQEFTPRKTDSINFDIKFLDYNFSDKENNTFQNVPMDRKIDENVMEHTLNIIPTGESFKLTERDIDFNFKKYIADFLKDNVKEADVFFNIFLTKDIVHDEKFVHENNCFVKLKGRLTTLSYFLAAEGRIKIPDTIVLNTVTNNLYKNSLPEAMNVVINDYVDNDVFYLICNNTDIDVGYKFYYHTDNDNKLYADIITVGNAKNQAVKLVIYP